MDLYQGGNLDSHFCVPVQMFIENTRFRLAVRDCVSEGSQQRHPIEEIQMRRTPAVRRAEAEKRNLASSQIGKSVGPGTFPPADNVSVPDGYPFGFPTQIVDVPVWTCRGPQMTTDPAPSTHPALGRYRCKRRSPVASQACPTDQLGRSSAAWRGGRARRYRDGIAWSA